MQSAFVLAMDWLSRSMFASRWLRVLWWRRMALVTGEVSITIVGGVDSVVVVGFMWCCCVVTLRRGKVVGVACFCCVLKVGEWCWRGGEEIRLVH